MPTTNPATSVENLSTDVDNVSHNFLSPLGEKIFLDRYALKDGSKQSLAVGDTVIVCVDLKTGQREIGTVHSLSNGVATIELRDGAMVERAVEHIDKPLEVLPEQMMARVARGIAAVEATEEKRAEWEKKFRWLLDGWKFVPGGRILTAAGTEQQLTLYNCYVIASPRDSRKGIVDTLSQMMEIMSRGGGVGINISSLRPRHAYVKGVNGRSSGAVSWGALYSFVTGLIEQGGCFGPEERILTNQGLLPARELCDRLAAGECLYAQTHQGLRPFTAYFRNGVKPLYAVTTRRGYRVCVTAEHKMAVLREGAIATEPLADLREGDEILLLLGEGVHKGYVALKPVAYERSIMSTTLNEKVKLPSVLDEDVAYLIGYMYGDGYVHIGRKVNWSAPKAVKMATADAYPEIRQRIVETIRRVFGLEPKIEESDGAVKKVAVHSRLLIEWLMANGLLKAKADQIRVPEAIFRSPSSVMGAFIAGYFDADGCYRGRKAGYGMDSISLPMLRDVQQILAINGIVSRISATDRSAQGWQTIYRLTITGATFKQRFAHFVSTAKKSSDNGKRDMFHTYPAEVWTNLGARAKYRQRIYDGVSDRISVGQMRGIGERLANDGQVAIAERVEELLNTLPDPIVSIEPVGTSEVYDFEVDDVHLLSGGGIYTSNSRRGALMLILNVWHPDVLDFIASKREMGKITNANISVGITDDFMQAVKEDRDWDLVFPDTGDPDYDELWDGDLPKWKALGKPVIVHKTVRARDVWNAIIESAWASAEPGVWFMERANAMSNSFYYAPLVSTNPCGEQPLPAWSVCNLGAINLAKFVWDGQNVDWEALRKTVRYAVRFLDNVIDATPYFFEENEKQQKSERRVGLGTMGLAEMLIRLGIRYGSEESVKFIDQLYKFIATEAYLASAEYAEEKGSFPLFDAEKFLQSGFMKSMPDHVRETIRQKGCRNVTLLTQAPTGTTGTMVGTSTGIEPFYFWTYYRKSRLGKHEEKVKVLEEWRQAHPDEPLPDYFVTAMDLTPEEHVRVEAAIQRWTDSSISKTCNVPQNYTVEQTRQLYELMYELGCKGGTIYRDKSRDEQVLNLKETAAEGGGAGASASPKKPVPKVRPRPYKRRGVTISKATPVGTAHITMNDDDEGNPFEVFLEIGKAGSDIKAMAEAVGRLMSLVLRLASPVTPKERVQEIVNQIRGIGGARHLGFGKDRVMSLPDAVGQALEEHYGVQGNGNGHSLLEDETPAAANGKPPYAGADLCPQCGLAVFVRTEGCHTCLSCGYSEC